MKSSGTSYFEKTSESTGSLKEGKKHGKWTDRDDNGSAWEGSYVEGKRQGDWVVRFSNGGVAEGPYVEGQVSRPVDHRPRGRK